MGGLLDAVAAGMRALPEVQPERLSVKVRQLAPQLRSIGIEIEFRREMNGRFVAVALTAERDEFANVRERTLIDDRFGVFIDQENRAAG